MEDKTVRASLVIAYDSRHNSWRYFFAMLTRREVKYLFENRISPRDFDVMIMNGHWKERTGDPSANWSEVLYHIPIMVDL